MPQCHTQAQEPVGQGQGLILKAKDLTIKAKDKICPRGHLNAKDQGQGQQHWYYYYNHHHLHHHHYYY